MPSNFDLTGVYQEELGEALDRIRTLEAQRDELLAALEACLPYISEQYDDSRAVSERARAAIRKAKGEA